MSDIEISDLNFYYPKVAKAALNGINLHIQGGQCLGLIGPNGSGKSTLLSILSGLLIPTTGTLSFTHNKNLSLVKFIQQHVALVPQEYAFYPQLSVSQNLRYFASLCGIKAKEQKNQVALVLQQCQLEKVSHQLASTLSGGYKRRLNLAIGLLKSPSILYLDEPTVGVDPSSRAAIMALLQALKKQGTTIIYTSHLLSEVQEICDQIIMLNKGQATQLELGEGQKVLSMTVEHTAINVWQDRFAAIGLEFNLQGNNFELTLDSYNTLLPILDLIRHSPEPLLGLHYAATSLTQHYLNHVEKNDPTEH
jgi:ABC-2 type transport system ATP-binding protein